MGTGENQVVLRISLDEGKTEQQLQKLAAELAKARDEQKALTKAREQGLVSEESYGKESVRLAELLRKQQAEQRNLTKLLDNYRAAQNAEAESYDSLQSQLTIA
ncbi:hypothetical protein, partial [Enterococcus faecalis]|uniref:hypothetical protein n=1 Tax=Enterococcus faecalis TaxID=1351 RepID=UPI0015CCA041